MSVLIFYKAQPQEDVDMQEVEDKGNGQEQENGENLLFLLPLKWVC
jgi:hypothetical protein